MDEVTEASKQEVPAEAESAQKEDCLPQDMKQLLESQLESDFVIELDGVKLPVHRCILACRYITHFIGVAKHAKGVNISRLCFSLPSRNRAQALRKSRQEV